MQSGRSFNLANVFADHRAAKFSEEFATEWAAALLWRPPALLLAWALQTAPVTPTGLTLTGLFTLPLMALSAAFLPPAGALGSVVVLAVLFMVIDCADGTLARITSRSSGLGQYTDFAADICYRLVFYGSAGWVLAQHQSLTTSWLAGGGFAAALISAWMMTFARLCRVYAELRFPRVRESAPTPKAGNSMTLAGFVSGFDGLMPLVAAAAWFLGQPQAFFLWIFLYALLDVGYTQWGIVTDLRSRP